MLGRSFKFILFILLGLLLLAFGQARAQRLQVRHYDMRSGLVHSRVNTIHQDVKGYLWFGTWEGLSRFDGYRFINYDTRDGLGHLLINSIAEDRLGRLWIATNGGGVSRLIDDPAEARSPISGEQPRKKFASFQVGESVNSNKVNVLIFDSDDNLWCGTDDGIYRSTSHRSGSPEFELVVPTKPTYSALLDQQGRFWFGCEKELIGIVAGDIIEYGGADNAGFDYISGLAEDHRGRLFLTDRHGLFEFIEPENRQAPGQWKRLPLLLQPGQEIFRVVVDSSGTLWIGSIRGLIKYAEGQRVYTVADGLSGEKIGAIYEDRDGTFGLAPGTAGCRNCPAEWHSALLGLRACRNSMSSRSLRATKGVSMRAPARVDLSNS